MNLADITDINRELEDLENTEIFNSKETVHSKITAYLY